MAFLRKQSQGVETPEVNTGGGMLGSSEATGKKQTSQAGLPGGWTNIQDYLTANQGDNTNINVAKQKTGEQINKGASTVAEQTSNLTTLPTANTFDQNKLNTALANDDYPVFQGVNQQALINQINQLPTAQNEISGYSPLETNMSNLKPNDFQSTMQFIGDLAPDSPSYSTGQKSFDTMLLQGNPEFRTSFVPETQAQYKSQYLTPLEQARTSREGAKKQAQSDITQAQESWKTGLQNYLTGEESKIAGRQASQQADYDRVNKDAKIDVEANKNAYRQATGQEPPASLVSAWTNAKNQASQRLAEFEGGVFLKPSQSTALNEYLGRETDKTRMQDLQALYSALGLTPKYQQPASNEQYSYFGRA